jgi:esterase/lipase superfamily enzyme
MFAMATTVYFATNRIISGSPEDYRHYGESIVPPTNPSAITYGTAFVEDANLTADTVGAITSIQDISKGGFSQKAAADLSDPGRNLLIFFHGFDNSFENAITRAAFNQQWFAKSGAGGANTMVVAFSWPSLGKLISVGLPQEDYFHDQMMAGQSGAHIMAFFANLEPIIKRARMTGRRSLLLAHSMGNWALQAGVESWFVHGNGITVLFDEAILAAADERYDSFSFPTPGRLSNLSQLAKRISIYYSTADAVLCLSMVLNLGAQRIGQKGPHDRFDTKLFPPATYRMVNCSSFNDYDRDFQGSHQYYRRSPKARADIAGVM